MSAKSVCWMVRWDDVFLGGFDPHGLPYWMPKSEGVRYSTFAGARECADLAAHRHPCSDPRVVRLGKREKR